MYARPVCCVLERRSASHTRSVNDLKASLLFASFGSIGREMGILLGKLHRPFLSDGTAWHNTWLQELRQAVQNARATAVGIEALSLCDRTLAYIESISPHLFSLLPMGAMHGDFSTRNVLCMDGHVCAIIDFELAHDGNVELELARFIRRSCVAHPPASPHSKPDMQKMRS